MSRGQHLWKPCWRCRGHRGSGIAMRGCGLGALGGCCGGRGGTVGLVSSSSSSSVAAVLHARRPLVPGPIVVCGRSCTGCVAFAERVSVALSVRAVATGAGAAGAEEADTEMGARAAERGGGRSRPAVGRLLPLRAVSSLYACCSQAASSACNAAPYYSSNNASHLPRQREKFLNSKTSKTRK